MSPPARREGPVGAPAEGGRDDADRSPGADARRGDAPSGNGRERPVRRRVFSLRTVRDLFLGVPRFVKLLFRLMRDPRVSVLDRVLFGLTLGYVLVPFDLLPDWLPVVGELDDLVIVLISLDRLLYRTDEAILLEHWDGDAEPLLRLRDLLERGAARLPGWARGLLRGG